jgi:hypothetical protein
MLGDPSVAAELAVPQEGLSSMSNNNKESNSPLSQTELL